MHGINDLERVHFIEIGIDLIGIVIGGGIALSLFLLLPSYRCIRTYIYCVCVHCNPCFMRTYMFLSMKTIILTKLVKDPYFNV